VGRPRADGWRALSVSSCTSLASTSTRFFSWACPRGRKVELETLGETGPEVLRNLHDRLGDGGWSDVGFDAIDILRALEERGGLASPRVLASPRFLARNRVTRRKPVEPGHGGAPHESRSRASPSALPRRGRCRRGRHRLDSGRRRLGRTYRARQLSVVGACPTGC
jgi:hypothetical protein